MQRRVYPTVLSFSSYLRAIIATKNAQRHKAAATKTMDAQFFWSAAAQPPLSSFVFDP
jgi:hypothetical protein